VHPSRWRTRAPLPLGPTTAEPGASDRLASELLAPEPLAPEPLAREPLAKLSPAASMQPEPAPRDRASERVREAGGPMDEASYVCDCGYVFCASVSTTVVCPHCGATQAW
jgi:hypothetical protein